MDSQDPLRISAEDEMHKKHKKRTKRIVAQLQDQIEFYFGDANLHKDRFMKQEISKDPDGFVSISTIASFNKMKQITEDINLVIKAMKTSSMLEVSDDNTMVRRTTAVPEARNVDAETVYVERLPPYADHDWLKGIFSKYGKVVYVSIPRYKQTGDIKGFAFVEFESAKEAQEAVEAFDKEGKHKHTSETAEEKSENGVNTEQSVEQPKPTKGRRKRSHSESEVEVQKHKERKRRRTISETSADSCEAEQNSNEVSSVDNKRKRKESKSGEEGIEKGKNEEAELSSEQNGKEKKGKKSVRWREGEEERNIDKEGSEVQSRKRTHADTVEDDTSVEQKRKKISDKSDSNAEESGEDESAKDSKKRKKRKRKKKEKKETRLPHLRVISKLEWLELKKEYKNLQREAMKNLKKQLHEKSSTDTSQVENKPQTQSQEQAAGSNNKKQNKTRKKDSEAAVKELPYTPGVVLKFNCQSVGVTKKEIRDKFSSYAPVAYLELTEGSDEGYVRFHTAEKCSTVFEKMSNTKDELKLHKLTEEDEKAYWEKINADRINRFNSKRGKRRGTEKVARKAEALQVQRQSHIRFDDSEGEGET